MGEIIEKSKGRMKQAVGSVTGNEKLKAEGAADELRGRVAGIAESMKKAARDAKNAIKSAVK